MCIMKPSFIGFVFFFEGEKTRKTHYACTKQLLQAGTLLPW